MFPATPMHFTGSSRLLHHVVLPVPPSPDQAENPPTKLSHEALFDFHEWVGGVACGFVGRVVAHRTFNGGGGEVVGDDSSVAWTLPSAAAAGFQNVEVDFTPGEATALGSSVAAEEAYVDVHTRRGLLTPPVITACLASVREAVNAGASPWGVVTAWSFSNLPPIVAPISVADHAASDSCTGATPSHYCFLVLPDDRYVVYTSPPV